MLSDLKKGDHQEEENGGGGSFNQWENANLGDDGANEKFRRLMGLGKKGNSPGAPAARWVTFEFGAIFGHGTA